MTIRARESAGFSRGRIRRIDSKKNETLRRLRLRAGIEVRFHGDSPDIRLTLADIFPGSSKDELQFRQTLMAEAAAAATTTAHDGCAAASSSLAHNDGASASTVPTCRAKISMAVSAPVVVVSVTPIVVVSAVTTPIIPVIAPIQSAVTPTIVIPGAISVITRVIGARNRVNRRPAVNDWGRRCDGDNITVWVSRINTIRSAKLPLNRPERS